LAKLKPVSSKPFALGVDETEVMENPDKLKLVDEFVKDNNLLNTKKRRMNPKKRFDLRRLSLPARHPPFRAPAAPPSPPLPPPPPPPPLPGNFVTKVTDRHMDQISIKTPYR
jgi:hypothetical protein